ncbi:MAG: hypothetical protein KAR11_01620 [Phycisphaerae bacterium]|nr:hypothetical protein [Phycisphaerae bacterium]
MMRCSRSIFTIVLILGSCSAGFARDEVPTDPQLVNAAQEQMQRAKKLRRFWVVRPCAIEWNKDNPETGEMFVGCATQWYHLLVPGQIKRVGWQEWYVPNITQFGAIKTDVIYGQTNDERWFIAKPGDGSLPVFFSDEEKWRLKLADLGLDGEPEMVNIRDGYHAAQQSLWIERIAWGGIFAGVVSLPWMIARYLRLRKKLKKGSKSSSK